MDRNIDLSKYIINKCHKNGWGITVSKLQKLIYFIYKEYYKTYNKKLFEEDIIRAVGGVRIERILAKFGRYKYHQLPKQEYVEIEESKKEVADEVIKVYGIFDGKFLEELIFQESIINDTPIGSNIDLRKVYN